MHTDIHICLAHLEERTYIYIYIYVYIYIYLSVCTCSCVLVQLSEVFFDCFRFLEQGRSRLDFFMAACMSRAGPGRPGLYTSRP